MSLYETRSATEHLFNIAVLDEDGVIYQVNPAAESLFNTKITTYAS
ncbi:MAG: PAS domain-containing protein [Cyanomargarita calcarea GSE-NOS-MK-12-04C]|uniref:PAS domain-containing protein n=1 Tax=Cyanomargarita calcarea GSE-NOS-MK-12-04C TaxID=2839659 RepID=A0A951QTU0_9CYAN|nr:PAS domain-containing protein [Cyanomargarita calcarea GSE-NOS-MK-12-04C]